MANSAMTASSLSSLSIASLICQRSLLAAFNSDSVGAVVLIFQLLDLKWQPVPCLYVSCGRFMLGLILFWITQPSFDLRIVIKSIDPTLTQSSLLFQQLTRLRNLNTYFISFASVAKHCILISLHVLYLG